MLRNLSGSLQNTLTYKNFDLTFNLSFTLGGYSYDNGMYALLDDGNNASLNKSVKLRDRWQNPGDITDVPQYYHGNGWGGWYNSSRGIQSSDHIRLKNLILNYRLPQKWISKVKMQNAKIFVSGTNLLTFAAYDQWDPELIGAVGFGVPPLKTISLGIELTF